LLSASILIWWLTLSFTQLLGSVVNSYNSNSCYNSYSIKREGFLGVSIYFGFIVGLMSCSVLDKFKI
jgi:hypothetical protein